MTVTSRAPKSGPHGRPGRGARALRPLRHPLHSAESEVSHLRGVALEGRSAATPVILIAVWLAVVLVLVPLVVGLAYLVASLVTR